MPELLENFLATDFISLKTLSAREDARILKPGADESLKELGVSSVECVDLGFLSLFVEINETKRFSTITGCTEVIVLKMERKIEKQISE